METHDNQARLPVGRDLRDFFCGLPEHDKWLRTRWWWKGVGQRLETALRLIATLTVDISRMNVAGDERADRLDDVRNDQWNTEDNAQPHGDA